MPTPAEAEIARIHQLSELQFDIASPKWANVQLACQILSVAEEFILDSSILIDEKEKIINAAYRRIALQVHPDKHSAEIIKKAAAQVFASTTAAHETLMHAIHEPSLYPVDGEKTFKESMDAFQGEIDVFSNIIALAEELSKKHAEEDERRKTRTEERRKHAEEEEQRKKVYEERIEQLKQKYPDLVIPEDPTRLAEEIITAFIRKSQRESDTFLIFQDVSFHVGKTLQFYGRSIDDLGLLIRQTFRSELSEKIESLIQALSFFFDTDSSSPYTLMSQLSAENQLLTLEEYQIKFEAIKRFFSELQSSEPQQPEPLQQDELFKGVLTYDDLMDAIHGQDIESVKRCLAEPTIDLNYLLKKSGQYEYGTTPLLKALGTSTGEDRLRCEVREQIALMILADPRLKLDIYPENNYSALHMALRFNHRESMIAALLDKAKNQIGLDLDRFLNGACR